MVDEAHRHRRVGIHPAGELEAVLLGMLALTAG
jgi:hypothetical protein